MRYVRAATVQPRAHTLETITILNELIPFLTNKEIIDYCGLPQNYIYEKIGKTGRRMIQTGVNIRDYKDKLDRLSELFEKTAYRNYKRPPKENKNALINNDKLHLYETAQNPFNQVHALWR